MRPDLQPPFTFLEDLQLEDYLILAAIVLLPWAFGGVEIWAYRTAAALIAGSAAVCLARRGWAGLGLDARARWLLPAVLLAVWASIQLIPLPSGVIGLLSPRAHALYQDAFPGYGEEAPEDVVAAIEARALSRVPEVAELEELQRPGAAPWLEPSGRWTGWRTLSLLPSAGWNGCCGTWRCSRRSWWCGCEPETGTAPTTTATRCS